MYVWVLLGSVCASAYIWYQYFRHIKWTFQWYGAKYLCYQYSLGLGFAIFEVFYNPKVEGGLVNILEGGLVFPFLGLIFLAVIWVLKVVGDSGFIERAQAKVDADRLQNANRLQNKKRPFVKRAPPPPPKKAPTARSETAKKDKNVSQKYNPVKGKDEGLAAVSSSVKLCVTCVHWQGNREIKPPATHIVHVNPYAKGMCLVKRLETPQAGSCGEHSKLGSLS